MKKIVNIALSLLIFLIIPVFFKAQAQTATPAPTNVPSDRNLGTPFCFTPTSPYKGNGHRALLQVKSTDQTTVASLGSENIYVTECISVKPDKTICTTAVNDNDIALFGNSPTADLSSIKYKFEGLKFEDGTTAANPLPAATVLTKPVVWGDSTPTGHTRYWLGFYFLQPPSPTPPSGQGGQQQGTFNFDFNSASKKCVPISWDPSGRVFDSRSLEPVNGVQVSLTRKQLDNSFKLVSPFDVTVTGGGTFINPFITVDDGSFSFFVADGTYHLTPVKAGYKFPSTATLNANYAKAYFDIYPALSAGGLDIVEKGGPQHRDIPFDSSSTPTVSPLKLLDVIYQGDRVGNAYVDGRVSHPLSVVSVYSTIPSPTDKSRRIRYRLIDTVTADKFGKFSIQVSQIDFDQTKSEAFGEIEIAKANIFTYDMSKTTVIRTFDPLPSYLQGTAYSSDSGTATALPNTTVGLYLTFSSKPYYETTTDSKGYFQIPSDFIPTMPYEIKYTGGGSSVTISTTKFLADNTSYITANKLNLFSPNFSDPKVNENIKKSLAGISGPKNGNEAVGGGQNNPAVSTGNAVSPQNMAIIGVVLVIIILLIAAGLVTFYLIKKNQNQTPTEL